MKIIIAGAHAIGTHLARLLSRSNEEITLIDESEERLASIGSDCDLLTMLGKPTSLHILRDAGVADADLFIAVTPVESTNITASILAKNLGAKRTVARVDNPEYMDQQAQEFFKGLGISKLIYPEMLAAVDINNGLKMSWVRQRWDVHDGALVMLGIKLREGCEILNEPLTNISGPNDPYHVVAIKRGSDTIIPGGNDELKLYDLAYFMTTRNYIPYIRKIVGKEHYVDVKNVMIMGGGRTAVRAVKKMPEYMECSVVHIPALAHPTHLQSVVDIHGSQHFRVNQFADAQFPEELLCLRLHILGVIHTGHGALGTQVLGKDARRDVHAFDGSDGDEQVGVGNSGISQRAQTGRLAQHGEQVAV